MATLFSRDVKTIRKHINNAINEELAESVVVAKFASTTKHGAIEEMLRLLEFWGGLLFNINESNETNNEKNISIYLEFKFICLI